MSTGKRLAKRSILGTRVSAPFDGHYYCGIIQGTKHMDIKSDTLYSVLFDNKINGRKVLLDFKAQDLIGSGFQSISNTTLNKGQRVYITYNGREVTGYVDLHNVSTDEVFLTVDLSTNPLITTNNAMNCSTNQTVQVRRRLDECRLSESRKSARLLESDTDYSRLAYEGHQWNDIRRRTSSMSSNISNCSVVSSHIDVPVLQTGRKRRPSSSSDDVMDDCMAAMVLMSLSCSPKSPRLPEGISHSWTSGSSWDSLISTASRTTTPSPPIPASMRYSSNSTRQKTHHRRHSPHNSVRDVLINNSSAPVTTKIDRTSPFSSVDEGIEIDEMVGFGLDDSLIKKKIRIIFQCTWPGCIHQCDQCNQIEEHVRTKHLGRTDVNGENSDHEEEFYYTEIEIDDSSLESSSGDSSSPTSSSSSSPGPQSPFASNDGISFKSIESQSPLPSPQTFFPPSSSAPVWSHLEDHEYLKHPIPIIASDSLGEIKIKFIHKLDSNPFFNSNNKNNNPVLTAPINIPSIGGPSNAHLYAKSAPISSPGAQSPRSQHKHMRMNHKNNVGTTLLLQSPTKTSPTKRVRGESRKCRKVYGMDNKDNWCTQCKWKKACTRFTD